MVDEHPVHGDAGLAAVERGPEPGGTRRQGQVGILQHEQGIATGQFQGGGNQAPSEGGGEDPSGGRAAGEADVVHVGLGQGLAGLACGRQTGDKIRRIAGPEQQFVQCPALAGATSEGFQTTPLPAVKACTRVTPLRNSG